MLRKLAMLLDGITFPLNEERNAQFIFFRQRPSFSALRQRLGSLLFIVFLFFGIKTFPDSIADSTQTPHQGESGFWESIHDFFLPHYEKRKILFEKDTQYFKVTVEEDSKAFRHLVFNPNKGSQGIWNPKSPGDLISNYCRYTSIIITAFEKPPEKMLFIGLGAGIMPIFLRKQFNDEQIDIVELDGEIPAIAEKYFGFTRDPKINIIIGDGREYMNRCMEKYDAIFIDAYNAESIPFQLTTIEFYQKVRNCLKPNGIMTANIANLGKSQFIASEIATARKIFPKLDVYLCANKTNYILFASPEMLFDYNKMKSNAVEIENSLKLSFKMSDILETRMSESKLNELTEKAAVLTDDFAPIETMK